MENHKHTLEALTCLPREELRQILAEELHKPTAEIDDGLVRALMAELHSRGANPAFADDEAVDNACAEFRMNIPKVQPHRKRWYQSWMLKVASIVLVLGILFFTLPSAAQADDIHEVLSWWSDSAFRFFNPGKQPNTHIYVYETDHPGLQQVYDTVTELGITDPIVPRWVPDSFELTELKTIQTVEETSLFIKFSCKKQHILILITQRTKEMTLQHEKDKNHITIWDIAGCDHYVVSNLNEHIVTWIRNGIECTLTTDCTEEDVFKIIKSIYTSEG